MQEETTNRDCLCSLKAVLGECQFKNEMVDKIESFMSENLLYPLYPCYIFKKRV